MESLIKQARVRFSDVQEGTEESTTIRGRKIPSERTQSFKGEKSKTQNWFQRQFSGSMSKDYDTSDGGDYSAAVAAAAYAINSLYENMTPQKKLSGFEMPDVSSTKIRGQTEDEPIKMRVPSRRSASFRESSSAKNEGDKEDKMTKMDKFARRSKTSSDDSSGSESSDEKFTSVRKFFGNSSGKTPPIKKRISFADNLPNRIEEKESERAITTKPSFKKRLSFSDDKPSFKRPPPFADNTLDRDESRRPEAAGLEPGTGFPLTGSQYTMETALPRPFPQTRVQGSKADAWERAEMDRIRKRYETLRSTIDSWENKKKEKAKRQKEKREREIEQKRAKVLLHFRHEIERVDAVAQGARAEAEKKRIKDELKVKKKANKFRTTGKLPPSYLCF